MATAIPKVKVEDIENDSSRGTDRARANDVTDAAAAAAGDEPEAETEEEEAARRYRKFTKETYARQVEQQREEKLRKAERESQLQEGRLVDGVLVFGDGEDKEEDDVDFDPFLQEGCNLPEDYPECPKNLFGVPIEEIDPHIKETVSTASQYMRVSRDIRVLMRTLRIR